MRGFRGFRGFGGFRVEDFKKGLIGKSALESLFLVSSVCL